MMPDQKASYEAFGGKHAGEADILVVDVWL